MKPFQQLPFDALPEAPRLPHPFFAAPAHDEVLRTQSFGPIRTRWRTFGSGPPLLLVHGLMTAGYSWRYVLEPLGARYTLWIPDLPGSGDTDKPDRPYHPDRMAEWIGEYAEAMGIRGCRCIGNSLGGYLVLRLLMRDAGAVGPTVDLHSPGIPLARLWALKAVLSSPGSTALLRALVGRDPRRWVHRMVHYYDESLKSLEEAREYARPLEEPAGVGAFARILRETLDPAEMARFRDALAGWTPPVPLMLLYAEQDPVVPPHVGDALAARLPTARYVRIAQASHFAHVDAVERFLPPVLDFLG
ncbi:MAG: alpha/beta fold hydrolase [Alphaproteobacteria bacterium]|nr:alpha/beta fold hydrolase [Alphaproteobacteria bacterium]